MALNVYRGGKFHSQLVHSSLGATDADSGSAVCKAWPKAPGNHATGTRADTADWGLISLL